jgi:hypothetical protein
MLIPRFWARAAEGSRTSLGWSDASSADAERMAHERLARVLELERGGSPADWDYYPSSPVKEEILATPLVPGVNVVITRNQSGALVLNTDRVAFVDVDLKERGASALAAIAGWFGRRKAARESEEVKALLRSREWAESNSASLRVYRTARGLRLLRMDELVDPSGDECERMFTALSADPQYGRLCRAQRSFRARLSPKPRRVDCPAAPGSHPRTDAEIAAKFRRWLESYERASAEKSVCELIAEFGTKHAVAPVRAVAEIHDRYTLRDGADLA